MVVAGAFASLETSPACAQGAPVELTKTDVTKLKTLDASQWAVLSVRLGDPKDAALKTLQRMGNIKSKKTPPPAGSLSSRPPPAIPW